MTDEDFLRHLDEHGAEPERWPPELRAAADAVLARSPALRAAREEALSFDRLLAGPPPPTVEEARVARLLAAVGTAARRTPQDTLVMLLLGRMPRRLAAGLGAALLALGWLAGSMAVPAPAPRGQEVALLGDEVATLFDGESR
ncbi:hypothetical protein [Azospirillum picis]|uniref:Uncharacterized protein n=1 Tax=Azospirillum picis TaxID=488438 RepID=A0ABU0MQH0_9PROT|nr:hypothetical protein [Azospirillum picis]MBP2302144.1 hypothetical protein [Azospirillum picis]MDQ0535723.1 hypothetical protein [Azospirillum picis]